MIGMAWRLAVRCKRQQRVIEHQADQIERLTERLRRIQDDVSLLALAVPRSKRRDALALVRDRHRIEDGQIVEEAER